MRVNEIAAEIHRRMVEDDRFGYDWSERWGANEETWTIDGKRYTIDVGDYDCSSSVITAWRLALEHTDYEGALDDAYYTGNMRRVFANSGLFTWEDMDFIADTGDLYLNEADHVAMCQTQEPDILSEFSINEFGGVYGGARGDQTGREAHLGRYYDYPWDGILHYNGKADEGQDGPAIPSDEIRYRASTDPAGEEWLDEMVGLWDTGGSDDDFAGEMGEPIRWLAIKGVKKYRVFTAESGWLPWVTEYDPSDLEYGCAGDGTPITGIQIKDASAIHQSHVLGGKWYAGMVGEHDTGGSSDPFGGDLVNEIDAFRVRRA